MRRSDRLFDLIQILRDGRLHRASEIADDLKVSVRTIWRDMATLMASGMPIEGERGVGYILRAPTTLPPVMLNGQELEALRLGIRLVAEGDDAALSKAAKSLAAKIAAVAPSVSMQEEDELFVFSGSAETRAESHLPKLHAAIKAQERLTISYLDLDGRESHRDIRPLLLSVGGRVWTLAAYCEARQDFRSFRLDRIIGLTATGEVFAQENGKDLAAYRQRIAKETLLPLSD